MKNPAGKIQIPLNPPFPKGDEFFEYSTFFIRTIMDVSVVPL
jgi:hypothetical protein